MEEENVKVVVRVRPMQTMEKKNGDIPCVKASEDGKEVQVKVGPLDAQVYKCNKCFPNDSTQALFFGESGITSLLDSAIEGYRACAFAFGQTGAGKTFTMVGPTKGINHRDKQVGMIARSLEYVFLKVKELHVMFSIKIACLEIYHENVYDLFAEEKERTSLAVREHATDGFFLEGCKMIECVDYEIACSALDVAMRNRQTGGHELNSRSSRSHCLTEIYIEIPTGRSDGSSGDPSDYRPGTNNNEFVTRGRMSLVDLAGSERLKSTNSTGKVLQEAGFINRSLYVLGKVIAGLVRTNGDLNHKDVPFRDSKLTKLLINSLSGKCNTLLISCVSEAKGSQAETLRTLKFSMSCARIRNRPVKLLDPHDRLIVDLRDEIKRLRNENKKLRSTIVTAPSSGEKSSSLFGPAGGGHFSDDDSATSSSSRQRRAISAHSSLGMPHNKAVGRKLLSPAKKSKSAQIASKMKNSNSDFLAEYGRGIRKSPVKQLKSMKRSVSNFVERSTEPILEMSGEEDALSYLNHNDDDDDNNSLQSNSSNSSKKMSQVQLEELVRRRAVGPMVLKNKDGLLLPVRETYDNSNALGTNYERSLEAARISKLEQRMAKMERLEKMRASGEGGVGSSVSSASPVDKPSAVLTTHEVKHDVQSNQKLTVRRDSPGTVAVKEAPKKKKKGKKVGKDSPYIAHLKAPEKTNKSTLPEIHAKVGTSGKPPVAPVSVVKDPQESAPMRSSMTALHDSILAELQEMGLEPMPTATASEAKKMAPKKTTTIIKKSTTQQSAQSKPNVSNKQGSARSSSSSRDRLPDITTVDKKAVQSSESSKVVNANILPSIGIGVNRNISSSGGGAKKTTPLKSFSPTHSLHLSDGPRSSSSSSSAVESVKKKLLSLEKSLSAQQEEMEDNPGQVTSETEQRLAFLRNEAKGMRLELEMATGGRISGRVASAGDAYDQDGFEDDDDKEDGGLSIEVEDMSSNSQDNLPTPAAVREMAAAMKEINAASMAAKNTNSRGGNRPLSAPKSIPKSVARTVHQKEQEEEEEEGAYGDEDFEADFEQEQEQKEEREKTPTKAVPAKETLLPVSPTTAVIDPVVLNLTPRRQSITPPAETPTPIVVPAAVASLVQVSAVTSREENEKTVDEGDYEDEFDAPEPALVKKDVIPQTHSTVPVQQISTDSIKLNSVNTVTPNTISSKAAQQSDNPFSISDDEGKTSPARSVPVVSASTKEPSQPSPRETRTQPISPEPRKSSNQLRDEEEDGQRLLLQQQQVTDGEDGAAYAADDFDEYDMSFEEA